MNAFRHAGFRMILAIGVTLGLAALFGDAVRAFEARTIASALSSWFGVDVEAVVGGAILVEQYESAPVIARITLSCSAIVGVITFFSVSAVFMHGRPLQARFRAFLLASAVWGGVNLVRIGGAVNQED